MRNCDTVTGDGKRPKAGDTVECAGPVWQDGQAHRGPWTITEIVQVRPGVVSVRLVNPEGVEHKDSPKFGRFRAVEE